MSVRVQDVIDALEDFAPLPLQESYDNAGLQVGLTEAEVSGALLCLDVTEGVIREALELGCNMIVSHHPLIFHGLKHLTDEDAVQRCVRMALQNDIAIYSAHTSLDNAPGGVNFEIAGRIGLTDLEWLQPKDGEDAGSGVIGLLPDPEVDKEFLARLQDTFLVRDLRHSGCSGRMIRKVALCGGAGAFLMRDAIRKGADCFITGEFHYHDYFENDGMLLAELGHYESEQYTIDLLAGLLRESLPGLDVQLTSLNTNPIQNII